MTIAVVDNGSLEPASHRNLRTVALGLSARAGRPVAAVSLKHSGRIPADMLDGNPAQTLSPWVRSRLAAGEREFLLVPFFISPQGAIGSALGGELDALSRETGGFSYVFSSGLADEGVLASIVVARVREAMARANLRRPPVIVVDHGGPARASAALRDAVASEVRSQLAGDAGPLEAASLESPEGPEFNYNEPLFAAQLAAPGFDRGDVVVAPLFLSPGRHAGPAGDLARIAAEAGARNPGLRVHFTALVGDHPLAVEALARGLVSRLGPKAATLP
jgi:hypothetical protein